MSQLFYLPFNPVFNSRGLPVGAAQAYFFYTGTTDLAPVYSDGALTTRAENPVTADALGQLPTLYLDDTITYRLRVVDARGQQLGADYDPYIPGKENAGPPGPANSTYTTLAGLKAAAVSNASYIFAPPSGSDGGAAAGTFLYQTAGAPYTADGVNVIKLDAVPLTIGALVRQAATGITYKAPQDGALLRSVSEKLGDTALCVYDFMTPQQIAAARGRTNPPVVTDAFNAAFEQARLLSRTVFIPDGVYYVGNLIFGTQSTSGQSSTPLGLVGQSKIGTILLALPGLTGTMLKSWSCAGIVFANFTLITSGTSAQAWDCAWKAGAGPSTQCVFHAILIEGSKAIPAGVAHWNIDDMNDSYPTDVTVRIPDDLTASSCAISAIQSGGLTLLRGVIWSLGYLRIACQNGKLDACWGHGIELVPGCINNLEVSAGYIYGNPTKQSVVWSSSKAPQQSARALTFTATQFITEVVPIDNYFDVNAYSIIKIVTPEFIGPTTKLLSTTSRPDSFSTVLVKIEGGKHDGRLLLEDRPGFEIEAEAFVNDMTGRMVTKNRGSGFVPIVMGSGAAGSATYAQQVGAWTRTGNRLDFDLDVEWSGHTGTGQILVSGLPLINAGRAAGVSIGYFGNTFGGLAASGIIGAGGLQIAFFTPNGAAAPIPAAGRLQITGSYQVDA